MPGFMSGFGSAFANSFSQAQQASAQEKQDKFKMQFADYVSRRDKYDEIDRENAKNVKAAKAIVSATGQPTEAWGTAYQLISGGMSPDDVMKQFQNNQAVVTPKNPAADPSAAVADATNPAAPAAPTDPRDTSLTQGAAGAVDAQMKTSGMATPQGGGIFGKVKDAIFGGGAEDRANVPDRNQQKISEVTGDSPDQISKTMARKPIDGDPIPGVDDYQVSWKPKPTVFDPTKINNLNDAIAYQLDMNERGSPAEKARAKTLVEAYQHSNAEASKNRAIEMGVAGVEPTRAAIADDKGGWTGGFAHRMPDGNGNMVWKDQNNQIVDEKKLFPYTKGMEDEISKQSQAQQKPLQDYHNNVNNFLQMSRISGKLSSLASQMPQGLDLSGNVLQTIDRYRRNGINLFNTLVGPQQDKDGNVVVSSSVLSKLDATEKELEKSVDGTTGRISDAALAATLMDIQATKLAYMYAASQGQTGRSVSAKEFDAFKQSAMGNGNPEGLTVSAADFLQDMYKGLKDQEAQLISGGSMGSDFFARFHVPSPLQIGPTIDDVINNDPEVKTNFEKSKSTLEKNSLTQTKQPEGSKTPLPEDVTKNFPAITQQDWDNMDEADKRLFTGGK